MENSQQESLHEDQGASWEMFSLRERVCEIYKVVQASGSCPRMGETLEVPDM